MESYKLEIVVHSGKALNDVKIFGTMDPYAIVWIAGGEITKPMAFKTQVAKKGASCPVWECRMEFNLPSMDNNYTLFCVIKHDGKLFDRDIGQVQVPFKNFLDGDAFGENVSYPVTISSGEVEGEIILSHKFSEQKLGVSSGGKVQGKKNKRYYAKKVAEAILQVAVDVTVGAVLA